MSTEIASTMSKMKEIVPAVSKMEKEAYDLLQKHLGEEKIVLPIPIESVAESLGVEIRTADLNFANPRKENQRIGELSGKCITIDESVDWKVGRYAVAHELGHYLVNEMDWNKNKGRTVRYTLPLLPTDEAEVFADIYALFLMMPFPIYLQKFQEYLNAIVSYPIDITSWWNELSDQAGIPFHSIASGYSWLQLRAVEHYNEKVTKAKSLQEQIKNYGELFS